MKATGFKTSMGLLTLLTLATLIGMTAAHSWALLACACLLPTLLMSLAFVDDGGRLRDMFSPRKASWALLADPFVAASAVAFGIARPRIDSYATYFSSLLVAVVCALIGLIAIRQFDRHRYARHHATKLLDAGSKIVHDFYSLTTLAGIVCANALAAIMSGAFNKAFWVGVALVGVWALGGLKDLIYEPNPHDQHPVGPLSS